MVLDHRAKLLQRDLIGVADENDAMGVAHRDAVDGVRFAQHLQPMAQHQLAGRSTGMLRGASSGEPHVHPDGVHPAAPGVQRQQLQAGAGHQRQRRFVRQPTLVDVFPDAARGVAAHFAFAAVAVEDAHPEVRDLRRLDQHQSVAAHAEVGAAHPHRQRSGVADGLLKAVDINVVVSDALHLGKTHNGRSLSRKFPEQ